VSSPLIQAVPESARVFVRFPNEKTRGKAAPALGDSGGRLYYSKFDPRLVVAELQPWQLDDLRNEGAEVVPSRQYEYLLNYRSPELVYTPIEHHSRSLSDVVSRVKADMAWPTATGDGVHIAVIDTGVSEVAEFPAWKRSPHRWAGSEGESAWTDIRGHGSMVAAIAAGTRKNGGRYDGIAPGAKIIACKTSFEDTELVLIYEYLTDLLEKKEIGRLVINNSYGLYSAHDPGLTLSDPLVAAVQGAVEHGAVVVFAAGNNHVKVAGHQPLDCGPNSIWGVNSLDEVLSVGTVDELNRMDQPPQRAGGFSHRDSSRGPGQFSKHHKKPDCVAPTYGEVVWGGGYLSMPWWGTSGAAPQVAGLAALILEKRPKLKPTEVMDLIRHSCTKLPLERTCVGAGLINCAAAVEAA
jgi:serine protease AprX